MEHPNLFGSSLILLDIKFDLLVKDSFRGGLLEFNLNQFYHDIYIASLQLNTLLRLTLFSCYRA